MDWLKAKLLTENQEAKDKPNSGNDKEGPPPIKANDTIQDVDAKVSFVSAALLVNNRISKGEISAAWGNLRQDNSIPVPWRFVRSTGAEEEEIEVESINNNKGINVNIAEKIEVETIYSDKENN